MDAGPRVSAFRAGSQVHTKVYTPREAQLLWLRATHLEGLVSSRCLPGERHRGLLGTAKAESPLSSPEEPESARAVTSSGLISIFLENNNNVNIASNVSCHSDPLSTTTSEAATWQVAA